MILQMSATDKLVDLNPWNFDTKNVKQYAKGGKKDKTEWWPWEAHYLSRISQP